MTRTLHERLESRRPEIVRTILVRVYAVSDPTETEDAEYVAGLRAAVSAAVDCGLTAVEGKSDEGVPIPAELLTQARHASRSSVSLDTVLRRYLGGGALLSDFVLREGEGPDPVPGPELQQALRVISSLMDRFLAAVSSEYEHENARRLRSPERRLVERLRRLLSGEQLEIGELDYDLDAWHLGMAGYGSGAAGAIRDLAAALGRRPLIVRPDEERVWAWLGGRQRLSTREVLGLAERTLPPAARLAFGEPGEGQYGWRLSHRQAMAALPLARRDSRPVLRYADVALLASALRDEVLRDSLSRIYLEPLARGFEDEKVASETLRAYFAAGRNISSAASALGVSRQTVGSRLQAIEDLLGRPLGSCAAEMEVALRLESGGDLVSRLSPTKST